VYTNQEDAKARGEAARRSMVNRFSQATVGSQVIARVKHVTELAVARKIRREKEAAAAAKLKGEQEAAAREMAAKVANRIAKIKINDNGEGGSLPAPGTPAPPPWTNSWNRGAAAVNSWPSRGSTAYSWRRSPPPPPALKRPPAAVSGSYPGLAGTCVGHEQGEYRYEVCFFKNVTQTSTRWNTVWVMGVYKEWHTEGPPSTMAFTEGDTCSGKDRQSSVKVTCSQEASGLALSDVSEPRTCEYSMEVTIPKAECDKADGKTNQAGGYASGGGALEVSAGWMGSSAGSAYASAAPGVT